MERILVFNDELPSQLSKRLDAEARKRRITKNDMACIIIARKYGMGYVSNSHYQASKTDRFRLRVPVELRDALAIDAAESRATIRGIALNILAVNYGLKPTSIHRRPRSTA